MCAWQGKKPFFYLIRIPSHIILIYRSNHPEVFLRKGVLKICSKFTEELPCRSVISIKLQITLHHGSSPVNLLHIVRTPFPRNTFRWVLLYLVVRGGSNLLNWWGPNSEIFLPDLRELFQRVQFFVVAKIS